jgi:hypothetical protein
MKIGRGPTLGDVSIEGIDDDGDLGGRLEEDKDKTSSVLWD